MQRAQLCPDNAVGHLGRSAHRRTEAAVDPGDQPFTVEELRVAKKTLRDEPRMLDKIVGGVDHAGNENLVLGNFHRLHVLPFVVVPRIGRLNADRLRYRLERDVDDPGERQIVRVRAFVIAPADVQPHAIGGQARCGRIEHGDIAFRDPASKFIIREMPVLIVARGGEIRGIDLQQESRLHDGAIFGLHHAGQSGQVGILARVMQVA